MKQDELIAIGCKIIQWNGNPALLEYYLPIRGNGRGREDSRLSVRFNFHPSEPVAAWLMVPSSAIRLEHVDTVEKFCLMYNLLTGKQI